MANRSSHSRLVSPQSMLFAALTLICGLLQPLPSGAQAAAPPPPPPLSGLMPQHATLSVASLDREAEWYAKVLGFTAGPRSFSDPNFLNQHLFLPGYRIDLIQYKGSSRPAPVDPLYLRQGWIHVCFSVPDFNAAFQQLKALKTDVVADNKNAQGQPTRLVLHDPEGNELELFGR